MLLTNWNAKISMDVSPKSGVEIIRSLSTLAQQIVACNGQANRVDVVRAPMEVLCEQQRLRPPALRRPPTPVFVAELMDTGGLGEGLLGLAARLTHLSLPLSMPRGLPTLPYLTSCPGNERVH